MQTRIRLGAVSYLNTKPLICGLEELADQIELVLDHPSGLADQLAQSKLDVALIPSVELFQKTGYRIVSDACIACRGPVLSVKLFGRRRVEQIRTLALDQGSRTSVALARILLKEQFGIEPKLEPLPVDQSLDATDADAVLLIGDRAIHSPVGKFAFVWDLGDMWYRWTELPFVFAMWTARPGVELGKLGAKLSEARNRGLTQLEQIAEREAPVLGLTAPQCLAYLRDNLYFRLGPREQHGLHLFYQHAVRLGLAPKGIDLGLEHCPNTG